MSSAAVLVLLATLTACAPQDEASLTAKAGPARTGQVDQVYTFDGSASFASTWAWSLVQTPPGSSLQDLEDADSPWPILVPDTEGVYVLELLACDSNALCVVDETQAFVGSQGLSTLIAQVHYRPGNGLGVLEDSDPVDFKGRPRLFKNRPPVAVASSRQSQRGQVEVILQGGESYDPDGDALEVSWSFEAIPAGSVLTDADLLDANAEVSGFTPDVAGTWQVRLTVDDGHKADAETVTLEIEGSP